MQVSSLHFADDFRELKENDSPSFPFEKIQTLSTAAFLANAHVRAPVLSPQFISAKEKLNPFHHKSNVVMVCSPGRSGSTILFLALNQRHNRRTVLKSHLLPPTNAFKGKIVFIFGNPDKAAESALHRMLEDSVFADHHFKHVENADRGWLKKIGNSKKQTTEENLLAVDALGCQGQLESWLHTKTVSCSKEEAQILAVKFEDLWSVADVIQKFVGFQFTLPLKKERGCAETQLTQEEKRYRELYNLGTKENPRYAAYDKARELWEKAPPFQYLKLSGAR